MGRGKGKGRINGGQFGVGVEAGLGQNVSCEKKKIVVCFIMDYQENRKLTMSVIKILSVLVQPPTNVLDRSATVHYCLVCLSDHY